MRAGERVYGKNEVIYREGDPSDAVYVVVSGHVELYKEDAEGKVTLSRVGPIEMFGETDILTGAPREASARALQKTRVRMVPQNEFLVWVQNEPNAGLRVLGLLVERLRAADTIIAREREGLPMRPVGSFGDVVETFLEWFRRRSGLRRNKPLSSGNGGSQPFLIGVATLNNDIEGAWTRALLGLFEGCAGIVVRELSETLQLDAGADQNQAMAAALRARQLLSREESLDLVIWGDVHADGYSLWFTTSGQVDDERPGSFSIYTPLELPAEQESPVPEMLYLAALAAIEPLNDMQRLMQYQLLASAQQGLPEMPSGLPVSWNMEQQRTALTAVGHAEATLAVLSGDAAWYPKAVEDYTAAINRLPRDDHGIEEAFLRRSLGGALQAASDGGQDMSLLEKAVEEYRGAAECLVKTVHPQEWGGAQNRLGQALYKLDLMTGQTTLLKESMTCFQAALQVFTRSELPLRWADVMNNLAQALQVYGDQVKSPEVLDRAVEACRAALEFRLRERNPMEWAASQNTLGTALFLLDKHSQSTEHLDEAAAAYEGALEVYRQFGASRQAQVAEKNLAHVRKLTKIRGERKVVMPDWADN